MLAIISGVEFMKTAWFVQLQTNKFQGFFKDKSRFSRTNTYSIINRHSLTPFWTHHWLKHLMHVILFKHKNVFTLHVSYIGSYTEDEPDFPRQNNLILLKTGVWRRRDSEFQFSKLFFKDLNQIGHFRVPKNLTFKRRLSAKPLLWKWEIFA